MVSSALKNHHCQSMGGSTKCAVCLVYHTKTSCSISHGKTDFSSSLQDEQSLRRHETHCLSSKSPRSSQQAVHLRYILNTTMIILCSKIRWIPRHASLSRASHIPQSPLCLVTKGNEWLAIILWCFRDRFYSKAILSPITLISYETHTQEAMNASFFHQQDEEAGTWTFLTDIVLSLCFITVTDLVVHWITSIVIETCVYQKRPPCWLCACCASDKQFTLMQKIRSEFAQHKSMTVK